MADGVSARRYGSSSKADVSNAGRIVRVHGQSHYLESDTAIDTYQAQVLFSQLTGIWEMNPHPSDPVANCRKIHVTDMMSREPWRFEINVEWSTDTPDSQQPNQQHDDPFADQVEIECDDELVTFPLFKDRDEELLANTLGEPVALAGEDSIEVITFTRNEPRRDPVRDRKFRNSVNANTYSGAAPGTVKIRKISSRRAFRKGTEYWIYRYELAYNPRGWQPEVLNESLYELKFGDKVPIVDSRGEPVTQPFPVDDLSAALTPSDEPHFLTFNTLPSEDFSELGLPE